MEKEDGSTERRKMEMVRDTLQQFMEERKLNSANGNKESEMEEDLLLSRLFSKLDSVETTSELNDSALAIPVNKHEKCSDPTSSENKKEEVTDLKEIAKDLKIIKRQNRITHNLLSALLVVTMIWQFGEVSVILAVREKITNPVRSIGDMIKNALTWKGKRSLIESPAYPPPTGVPEPNGSFPLLITK
ncbi:hypothetical protein FCM35_KLT12367 [Carex littledalei]|uniref:Uncharacterized protein n=1 Tax=Carex littledalei TaxID=544730 RepID=A0A833V318_9POAL|nr:hypothetical protein FCM35_KLT12367 [Carex littledalei]